jgi:O-antigen/teichoic acid export membrane protein
MESLRNKAYHLLRRSESFFKTDMVYLAKGGFWLTLGQGVASISTFLLAIAFANLLLPETYGTYKYVLSIAGILTVLTLRGMDLAVFQAIARGFEGVFFSALKTKLKWGFLSATASIVIATYYYINGNNTLSLSFVIIAGFLPLVDSFEIYHALLKGKKLFNLSSIYGSLSQVGSTIALIITILLTQNLFIILLVYFATWTLIRSIFFIITVKKHPPNQRYDPETISYGKRVSFINVLDTLVSSIDGILIFHYLGAAPLAIYSFAIAPISQLKSLTGQLPTLAMPKLAARPSEEINEPLKKRFAFLFVAGLLISFLYIIAAPYIYQIFFPKYLDAVFFSQIFSLTIALALPQTIFGAAISAKLTLIPPKMLYLWNLPGIVFLTFALIFVIKFGIMGVIIGRFLSLIAGFIVNLVVWRKIKIVEAMNLS